MCISVCTYVCVWVLQMCVNVYVQVCMYMCVCVCVHVCMYEKEPEKEKGKERDSLSLNRMHRSMGSSTITKGERAHETPPLQGRLLTANGDYKKVSLSSMV